MSLVTKLEFFGKGEVPFLKRYSPFWKISALAANGGTVASRAVLVSIFGLSRQFNYDL